MCLDTEKATVKSACKDYCKKVQASCSLTKWGLWKEAQLGWIGDSHQTVLGSNYNVINVTGWLSYEKFCMAPQVILT